MEKKYKSTIVEVRLQELLGKPSKSNLQSCGDSSRITLTKGIKMEAHQTSIQRTNSPMIFFLKSMLKRLLKCIYIFICYALDFSYQYIGLSICTIFVTFVAMISTVGHKIMYKI